MRTRLPFLSRRRGLTTLLGMPGLEACFDAQIPSSVNPDSVGRVAQWNDLTGKARHLTQGTLASQPLYLPWTGSNYGWLPGVAGNYFSTPDSAAVSITSDIDLRIRVNLQSYANGLLQMLFDKVNTDGQASYGFYIGSTGLLVFRYTPTGAFGALRSATSSATLSTAANTETWIRATYASASGNVNFYTSTDGTSWTALGTQQTITAGAIFDGTDALQIGASLPGGSTNFLVGRIIYAEIRNGIAGTVVAAFDPSRAADGVGSFVAATGETWTVNTSGGKPAQIVGRSSVLFDGADDLLKTAAFTFNQPSWIVMAGRVLTWTVNDKIWDGNAADTLDFYQTGTTPNLRMYAGVDGPQTSALALGQAGVVSAVYNAANSTLAINRGANATGNVGASNAGGFALGGRADGTQFGNFQAFGVAAFAVAPDARTQARVIEFLINRHRIPA